MIVPSRHHAELQDLVGVLIRFDRDEYLWSLDAEGTTVSFAAGSLFLVVRVSDVSALVVRLAGLHLASGELFDVWPIVRRLPNVRGAR